MMAKRCPDGYRVIDCFGIKPNSYCVSNTGKIVSLHTGKELAQIRVRGGYKFCGFQMANGGRQTFGVHRVVAAMFIPKTEEDIKYGRDFVNHKDLDTTNNHVSNLEWTTNLENIDHAIRNGAIEKARAKRKSEEGFDKITTRSMWGNAYTVGSRNGMSRLSEKQVHAICKSLENGSTNREAAIAGGLEGTVNDIVLVSGIRRGVRWRHISSEYKISSKSRGGVKENVASALAKYIPFILLEKSKNSSRRSIFDAIVKSAGKEPCTFYQFTNFMYRVEKGKTLKKLMKEIMK